MTLLGASVGAVLRYVVGGWVNHRTGPGFPWGTLAVNTAGCFGLGFLEGIAPQDGTLLFVLDSGVLAGFTTFSTLMLETLNLALAREDARAFLNVTGGVALGLPVFLAGIIWGRARGVKTAKRVRVFIGEDERYRGRPLFEAILLAARERGLAGATIFKGFMGYAPNAEVSTTDVLLLAENLPVVVDIVDDEERIDGFMPFLKRAVKTGIVVRSDVEAEQIASEEARG